MSADLWILVSTAVLAVVAISAAVVAVRAARRIAALPTPVAPAPGGEPAGSSTELTVFQEPSTPDVLEPRIIEGRVIVPPNEHQVVTTAMGRPAVRLSILAHGLSHALRPESRDRIVGLMRREVRRRRRERLQAGRRAARAVRPSQSSDQWLGS